MPYRATVVALARPSPVARVSAGNDSLALCDTQPGLLQTAGTHPSVQANIHTSSVSDFLVVLGPSGYLAAPADRASLHAGLLGPHVTRPRPLPLDFRDSGRAIEVDYTAASDLLHRHRRTHGPSHPPTPRPFSCALMPERTSSGGAARSRETVKLRDSCEICASAKVRCSKEKPSCSRCINRGLKCEYGLSRRNGRSATNSSSNNRDQDQSYCTHVKPPVVPVRRDSGSQNRQIDWTTDMAHVSTEEPHLAAMSQPMPHSMPAYPQTAPVSVPFTQEVPDLDISMLSNETNMDLFMVNSDVTTWTDVQPPWTAAACEPDHCCLNTALDLLRQLSITEASKACPRRGMPEQIPPPTLEMAATMNRTIIASLNTILGCSCSLNGNLLTIISLVTFKLIAWCASAAKNTPRADSPMSTAETMGSNAPIALKDLLRCPPAGLDGLMDAVGATGNEQIQAAAQTVLDDLYRVQDLVNLFSQRLNMARRRRSAVGGGSAASDIQAAMYNTSTTLSESVSAQLESDLRRRLRAVSFETVQILLRG